MVCIREKVMGEEGCTKSIEGIIIIFCDGPKKTQEIKGGAVFRCAHLAQSVSAFRATGAVSRDNEIKTKQDKNIMCSANALGVLNISQRSVAMKAADPDKKICPKEWPILPQRKRTSVENCRITKIKAGEYSIPMPITKLTKRGMLLTEETSSSAKVVDRAMRDRAPIKTTFLPPIRSARKPARMVAGMNMHKAKVVDPWACVARTVVDNLAIKVGRNTKKSW